MWGSPLVAGGRGTSGSEGRNVGQPARRGARGDRVVEVGPPRGPDELPVIERHRAPLRVRGGEPDGEPNVAALRAVGQAVVVVEGPRRGGRPPGQTRQVVLLADPDEPGEMPRGKHLTPFASSKDVKAGLWVARRLRRRGPGAARAYSHPERH